MKKIFLFLAALFLVSCSSKMTDKERIRQMAVDNYVSYFSPVSWLLQNYVRAYYTVPADEEEFLSFVKEYKQKDPFFSESQFFEGDILKALTKETILYAPFEDSIFFYLPKYKSGSSIIGTPFYWANHPEKYHYPYGNYYYSMIEPSAFRSNGAFLFDSEFNYSALASVNNAVCSHYNSFIYYEGNWLDPISETPHKEQVPYFSIAAYHPSSGSLEILTRILPADSLFIYNKEDKTYKPIDKPLEELCKDYLDEIASALNGIVEGNKDVAKILMEIHWCSND